MNKEELALILDKHQKWLNNENDGERADLRSANLRSANLRSADLRSADLRYADLRYANLRYANLRSANLRSADLRSADLRSADLSYADLRYATGQYYITQRADGYQFWLVKDVNGRWYIRAGCQHMTIKQYRKHAKKYDDEAKTTETNLILDFAEAKLNVVIQAIEGATDSEQ